MATIAIIGAGIAGLTAAYHLGRQGRVAEVFEAAAHPGGVIRSERTGGYLVEHGPNTLQANAPLLEALVGELGLEAERVEAAEAARNRYVVRGGVPVALPSSPPAFFTSSLFSLSAKLRLLREPFIRPGQGEEEESVAAFVRRRLGPELLDYAVNPFVAGIYAGDPEQLSLEHAFPRLHRLEKDHGSLLRGQLKLARAAKAAGEERPSRRLYSFRDGLQTLTDALAARLEGRLHLQAPVTALRPADGGWHLELRQGGRTERHRFDAVLYAAPLHRLAHLDLGAGLDAPPLRDVYHPPVSVMALGFRREHVAHPLDGFGLLVPAAENAFRILGTLFSSTLFPGRAPEGHVLLTTFVGGARHPELAGAPPDAVRALVQRDLNALLGLSGDPAFVRHVYWPEAIPQYRLGYGRVKEAIERLEREHPGFYMAGNYRQGISVGDALASGEAAARRLAEHFT